MNITKIPTDQAQKWEWIKYQLRARGLSLASVARELDVTRFAVNGVKLRPYPRVERAIAARLGLKPVQLWPHRWDGDTPYRQRPNRDESRSNNKGNCSVMHRKNTAEALSCAG